MKSWRLFHILCRGTSHEESILVRKSWILSHIFLSSVLMEKQCGKAVEEIRETFPYFVSRLLMAKIMIENTSRYESRNWQ